MSTREVQTDTIEHPQLGRIKGICLPKFSSTVYYNLPYATLEHRFSRSRLLPTLPQPAPYNATEPGPICIQPLHPVQTDTDGNQFPYSSDTHPNDDELSQSWNCLNLSITTPTTNNFKSPGSPKQVPVLVFIHGGAFALGSHSFPQYDPLHLIRQGHDSGNPFIFAAINYRLGPLGFFHHPEVADLIPANNGLHDQHIALKWLKRFIGGFGGDPDRITVIGQSAGGESLSLGIISGSLVDDDQSTTTPESLFRQAICFSGSPVTMPAKTPAEHATNFLTQAKKCKINTDGLTPRQIAQQLISTVSLSSIRELNWVGAPCTSTAMVPYPSLRMTTPFSQGTLRVHTPLNRVIYSSTTYDGGISYNLLSKTSKTNHAATFTSLVHSLLSPSAATALLSLYGITSGLCDSAALEAICQFESDIGFFFPSLYQARGSQASKTYLQLWDVKNPFDGPLGRGRKATHTWDIAALLGAYEEQEDLQSRLDVVREWRQRVIGFVCGGEDEPWEAWDEESGKILVVDDKGMRVEGKEWYLGAGTRRASLLEIARAEKGDEGCDFLWEGVCRKWLDG